VYFTPGSVGEDLFNLLGRLGVRSSEAEFGSCMLT
jgi:hypothetical protein